MSPDSRHRELPLQQQRRTRQWTRWFHYSVMLSLVAGMLAFAPLPFTGADGSLPWWPFGGQEDAPESEAVEVAVGDGTEDMDIAWDAELPDSGSGSEPGQVQTPPYEAEPQQLDLQMSGGEVPTGYVEGVSQEIASERTESTTVYANPDGTETLRIYQAPAFTEDDGGDLVPIDPDLERSGGRWEPEAAADVSFAAAGSDSDIIRFDAGPGAIQYGLDGAASVVAQVEGHQITYPEILPSTDLRFSVAGWGTKADIILADPDAAISWTFPLDLDAVTAEVDEASGSVQFLDVDGNAVAAVPAGFAEDSDIDPASGEGARSYDLEYEIIEGGQGPALRVTLDKEWFDDPARVFPVTVDPTLSSANGLTSGDTYVQNPFTNNFSGEGEIKVGHVDGNTAAGLVKFDTAMDALDDKYIRGATLSLYNTYSYSCTARQVKIHRITQSWSANSSMSWPGPSFDATPEATKSFAHGYGSGCGDAWETFTLDREHFTQWTHGTESFYGFRIEASRTDEKGYKRFASRQTSIPSASPFIDVVYADQGATYSLPTGAFTTSVTAVSAGTLPVRVTNWGSATWQSGSGYGLRVRVYDYATDKPYRASEGVFYATKDVAPGQYLTFTATVAPLPPGKYKLYISMVDPQGRWFSDTPYYVPLGTAGFVVKNLPPLIKGNSPGDGATIDTVQPSLWVQYNDADSPASNARYEYQICRGPDGNKDDCQSSGTQTAASWKIPAGFLKWGTTAFWYARVYDGTTWSAWTPGIELTPQPAQPPVTSHLAGASDGSTVPGLNPQVGNFTNTVTDAQVTAVGPLLAAQRTYNSQDLRTTGAFGTGWSTPWDQRLTVESDSTVLVVLESGRTVRFGKNPDVSFVSPLGESVDLQSTSTGYRMKDSDGQTREFNTTGQLVRILDAFGRGQTLTYTSGQLTKVTDDLSGRSLTLEWTGGHVTAVVVPAAQTGGTPARWTYTYTGDLLTKACSPLSTLDCTTYAYESTSFYEAAVQDANPRTYYTFDDIAIGATVDNRAADEQDEYDATSTGLLHTQVGGALTASDGRGLDLGGNPASVAQLPDNFLTGTATVGIELWFRAEPGERGTIFSLQNADDAAAYSGCAIPALYIGTDGLLHSGLWMSSGTSKLEELVYATSVTDGKWHHLVLTTGVTQQSLYLDGTQVDSASGRTLDQQRCNKGIIGSGWGSAAWAGMPATSGYDPFRGELDDLSLFTRTLTAEEIGFRYSAGKNATSRMTSVINDQGHTVWDIDYDRTTGRVDKVTDTNGAVWTLSDAVLAETSRLVSLSSSFGKSELYTYDALHNGRITSRADAIGTETWSYNDAGFVSGHRDGTGLVTEYTTDDKGRRTSVKTCRAEDICSTSYTAYYESSNPFDLRDGRVVWERDGRSTSATDNTYATGYTYNTQGQLLTTASPGSSTGSSNPKGTVTTTYTAGTETAVGGGTVPAGLTATVTNEVGALTTYAYSKSGDLVETVSSSGQVTRYAYDLLGRLVSTQIGSVSGGQFQSRDTTTDTLDAVGNTVATTGTAFTNPVTGDEHQLQQTFTYDDYGRLTSTSSWDAVDPIAVRTTGYEYDPAGRLTATSYPDGSVAVQHWNEAGLLSGETTSTGLELAYAYDQRGRLLTTSAVGAGVDPDDPDETELLLEYRTYYDNDWAASTTDALGRKTSWEYWGDGKVKRDLHTAPDGTETVTAQYEYDLAGNPVKVTNAVGTLTQTEYNARNWPTTVVVDPSGIADATVYAYDKTGRTTGLTYKYGATTYRTDSYAYNTAGAVTGTWTTAPTVEGTCVTEEGRSCLVAKTANTYNSEGLLATAATGNDGAESYTYNSLGQVATVLGAARQVWVDGLDEGTQAPVTTYGYNAFGELTHLEDADGNVTETQYDTSGRPVRTLMPAGTVPGATGTVNPQILTSYEPGGLVATEADPRGSVTSYEYDPYGRTLSVTSPDPDGTGPQTAPVATYEYDRAGQVVEQTDPNGAITTATYDAFGRVATAAATERTDTDLAYFTTAYTYDNAGQVLTETTPGGEQTTYTYDPLGRTKTVTDPAGVTTTNAYPAATQTTSTFADGGDGIARRSTSVTDVLGNPVKDLSETNTGTGWASVECAQNRYDLSGRTTSATTIARGTCTTLDTAYIYDSAGQLTTITGTVSDTSAITIGLGYDLLGNQTRMVDGNGTATVYGFNSWGLQDTTIEPATAADPDIADRTWTTVYDIAGNAVEQYVPGGIVQTAEYDRLGRKTTESGTGAEAATTVKHFEWDALGNLTGFSSDLGDTDVAYNDRGLITSITGTHTAAYEYNADGQMTERTDGAGTTGFTYTDGRLDTLTDPVTDTVHTYQWRSDGQLGGITSGSATRTFAYTGYGKLATDTITTGSQQRSIAYDYDGQLLTAKTTTGLPNAGTQTYSYDTQGRLTSWTGTDGIETTYAWDANSNRVAVNRWDTECGDQAATTRLYVYDERNRLTEAMDGAVQCTETGGTWQPQTTVPATDETWAYTARGTTATHEDPEGIQTTYAFDAFEQLKTAAVDGQTVANQYDALGRLIARNGNTAFAYDGLTNNLTATPTTNGTDRIVRDPAGGSISQSQDGITGLSWTDNHGDLVGVINPATGDLIAGGGLDPFGNPLPDTTDTTLTFQGGYTDPTTGETNAHARWYNPTTGTFTTRDTWQLAPNPVVQANRYLYAGGSPLSHDDRSGHFLQIAAVPAAAVAGAIIGAYFIGVALQECYENGCTGAWKKAGKKTKQFVEDAWDWASDKLGGNGNYGFRSNRDYQRSGMVSLNYQSGGGGGRGSGGAQTCSLCWGDDGGNDGGAGGNPWRPAPIDWNAYNTRPEGTAEDAANDEATQVDILNGALLNNPDLRDDLENQGFITVDADGNVTAIHWQDPESECTKHIKYGDAVWTKATSADYKDGYRATGAAAYLCGSLGGGTPADNKIEPWNWPKDNPDKALDGMMARCHLIARQLGGSGDDVKNLVTCYQNPMNSPLMRGLEGNVASAVKSGEHVIYVSVPQLDSKTGALSGIRVVAIGSNGYYADQCFSNKRDPGGLAYGTNC